MSGFAGGGAGGGPGPGGCASMVYQGLVEIATQGEVDARTAIGGSGCPVVIGPQQLRIYVATAPGPSLGAAAFLNHMGAFGPTALGASALDWQSSRAAANQTAQGDFSTAVGQNNGARGVRSSAFGFQNEALGQGDASVGCVNVVYGGNSAAVGSYNRVGGNSSACVGRNNTIGAGYNNSVAIGSTNLVTGIGGVAIGSNSQAVLNSVAIGSGAFATAGDNVAIGRTAQALNVRAIAIGLAAVGNGADAIAIGTSSGVGALQGVALGRLANVGVYGLNSMALGYGSTVRPARVTNITAPIFTRNDSGEPLANSDLFFSGANVLIMLPEVDISIVADYAATIAAAGNVRIWLEEVGLILTTRGAPVTTQPTVQFGIAGTPAKYLAPTLCTLLTALRLRERFNLLLVDEPETSLSFGIVAPAGVPGPASCFVRPYFRGHLVENE